MVTLTRAGAELQWETFTDSTFEKFRGSQRAAMPVASSRVSCAVHRESSRRPRHRAARHSMAPIDAASAQSNSPFLKHFKEHPMKTCTLSTFVTGLLCLAVSPGLAQIEVIGPLTLQPSSTDIQVFTNFIPPNPSYKELQFTGTVDVPPGAVADLYVEFDYIDPNNVNVVVPAPLSLFTAVGGAPTPVDTGILTLMFCPQVVSLHLTNRDQSGVSMNVQGLFRHECFPVPEPALGGWLGLASLGWFALRSRLAGCVI